MYMVIVLILGGVFGAVMGSFCCCQAWRIRCKEIGRAKVKGRKIGQRSLCLSCGKQLKWYENIPVVSWVIQRGKCRGCGAEIGKAEILSEVAGMVMFVGIFWRFWSIYEKAKVFLEREDSGNLVEPVAKVATGLYLKFEFPILVIISVVFFTLLFVIAIYDAKWQRIPLKVAEGAIITGGVVAVGKIFGAEGEWLKTMMEVMASVGFLGGVYYILYKASNERLVGGGDYLVGTAIGLFLSDWWLSLFALFVANLAAVVVMVPGRKRKIAFAPFLVLGGVVVFVLAEELLKYKLVV